MQEMMLSGGSGMVFPWSGPGNKKLLHGTRDLGYFGQVAAADLFTDASLATLTGLTAGTLINNPTQVWHKFILRGRVIYLARYPSRTNVAWNDLYAKGLVYGVKGAGDSPLPAGGAVDQFVVLPRSELINGVRKYWPLKVALQQGANDGVYPSNSTFDSDQSDWDVLWNKFFADGWDNWTWANMNNGKTYWFLTKERSADGAYAAVRGSTNVTTKSRVTVALVSTSVAWRPRLELVTDPNVALGVYYPGFDVKGAMQYPLMNMADGEAPIQSVRFVQAYNSHQQKFAVSMTTIDYKVYFNASTGREAVQASTDTVDTIQGVRNVAHVSALKPLGYQARMGKEEIFTSVPAATVNQAATVSTEDASLIAARRLVAINSAQSSKVGYRYRNVNGAVYASNGWTQSLPSPTFTIEADV